MNYNMQLHINLFEYGGKKARIEKFGQMMMKTRKLIHTKGVAPPEGTIAVVKES